MAIAIDSNVILYTFDDDALEKQGTARAILRSGKQAESPSRSRSSAKVFAVPIRLSSTDYAALTVSFWDAQIMAAAAEYDCSTLLSEDFRKGRRSTAAEAGRSLRIVNPLMT